MRLQAKIVILLSSLFLAYVAVDHAIQQRLIMPKFVEIERNQARTDMIRLSEALQRECLLLQVLASDWGNWAEVYRWIVTRDPKFIADNMGSETMKGASLNLVAFMDLEGRYAWRSGFAPGSFDPLPYALLEANALPAGHPWLAAVRSGRAQRGFVMTEHGPMMLTIGPILDGNGRGPTRGAVMMGRLLTGQEIKRLAEQARVSAEVLQPGTGLPELRQPAPESGPAAAPRLIERAATTEVYQPISDLFGRDLLVLKVTVPREITTQGREAMHFAAQSLMFAGLITLLVQMGLLRWLVLMPLDRITRHAVHVGRTDDLTDPINLQRRDELGVLATEFNRMMERLAQARVAMADATYRAGVAEMASGVLHNVGNALTPIGVKATVLRQRLEATPIAELDIALTELDGGGGDSARRADLESFLRLATRELATSARAAAATSEEIAAQVNAIQTILAQQSVLSRASHVAEPVRVDALVEQAARLVPADRRERLTVVVDPSVREVGVVRAARIAVQQVFQNLIQNACEAMRPGQRGTLTIRAALDSAAGSPELRVVFADDGAGIARENLGRIFDKGFSTKATATNSGIGLHWSANVLNALGGRIVAESGGPGRGAVMTVVLPLETPAAGKLEAAA